MRIRSAFAFICASLVTVTLTGGISYADSKSSREPSVELSNSVFPVEISARQAALIPYADMLSSLRTRGYALNYSSVYLDAERSTIKLYWKGNVPEDVRVIVEMAVRDGISVVVEEAKYSYAELQAEQTRLSGIKLTLNGTTDQISYISPKSDGSGLEIGVPPTTLDEKARSALSTLSQRQVLGQLKSAVDISLEYSPAPAATRSRYEDITPYSGGARLLRGSTTCSSGFSVRQAGSGRNYLLTNAHCGLGDWANGVGTPIGVARSDTYSREHDAMLIEVSLTASTIWDGPYYREEYAHFQKPVVGQSRAYAGQWVCQSGAASGVSCNARVASTGGEVTQRNFGVIKDVFRWESTDNQAISGNGDSGSPVFALNGDQSGVIALGLTSTQADYDPYLRPCRGTPDSATRKCSTRQWSPDIGTLMDGVRLPTGRALYVFTQ